MTGYSDYQPDGETLSFVCDYVEDSMIQFSQALEFRRIFGNVVRPWGCNFWLACAIDGTWIKVRDPDPSLPHWQVVTRDSVAAGVRHVSAVDPTPVVRVLDELSDDVLTGIFREAVDTSTAPSGFFVTFDLFSLTASLVRVVDDHLIGADGTFSEEFHGREVTFSTRKVGGVTWLDDPAGSGFMPPITYSVNFEGIPTAMVSVRWSRWLEKGTGEHEALQGVITSLIEAGWRHRGPSCHFDV